MFRTALRNVLAHRTRLLMTVLAVTLGVAFVAGTLVFTTTVSRAWERSSAEGFDHVDVAVRPGWREGTRDAFGDEERAPLTDETLRRSAETPGAASALGVVRGFTALAGKDGALVGDGWGSEGGNFSGPEDPRFPLVEGRAPRGEGEVLLDSRTAERTGYRVGDTVRLSVNGPVLTPRVTGVFTTDDGGVAAGGTLVLFDTATAQKLLGKEGVYDEIHVRAEPGVSQTALKTALDKALAKDAVETETADRLAESQATMIATQTEGLRQVLLVFAGVALFVGTFIIANTFTMLVAQRTRELALLRAVGASRRQVTRSVLLEAFVVGAVAGAAGLAAGMGVGVGLRALMGAIDAQVPDGPLLVPASAVVSAFAIGIGVTVLAAWLPARRAARVAPVAAMSSVHTPPTTKSLVLRNTVGALIAGAGAATVLVATGMDGDAGRAPMALGAALLITGVFVLTPLLSRPLVAAAEPVLRLFGTPGRLARRNAVRNPRRTAATASALMIGLTLITGMTVAAASLQHSIDTMATAALRADYVVSMANGDQLDPSVGEDLAGADGVTRVSPMRDARTLVDGEHLHLTGVDGPAFARLTDLPLRDGAFTVDGAKVVVDADTAGDRGWRTGSAFTATLEDGTKQRLTVAGVYEPNEMFRGVLADVDTLTPHLEDPGDMIVLVATEGGASAAAEAGLVKALGKNPALRVQDKKDVSAEVAQAVTLLLNMVYGLLAMAVVIAVLGVVNTLAMSVFERSQEIGMLRAIGLDQRGVRRMVRLESVVISLLGGVLGVGLGVFFGWAAGELAATELSTYEMVLPWGRILLFLAGAAAVGVLAAVWPARRAARMNMLAAIKAE